MMSFATPLYLLFALLAGPIILLYMLRLRRREVLISSTMLWQKLLRDREANAPWQRLRRNLLLFLQLLILGALAVALARPFLPVPSVISGSVVVLLDGSASMLATDVEPNRFAVARERIHNLVSDLGGGDQMTLILVGRTPQVLVSAAGDRATIRQAIVDIKAQPVEADWEGAFALAAGAAQGFEESRIVIISDGGLPDGLPSLPAEVVYLPVGRSSENLAFSALATRETALGPQLFAAVTNHGEVDRQVLVSVTLDDVLFDSRRLSISAGETGTLTWELPPDAREIGARLGDLDEDFLGIDDVSWAVLRAERGTRALLIGEGNRFLETALSVLPDLEVVRIPASEAIGETERASADLYVLDGVPPPDPLPSADLLLVNPLAAEEEATGLLDVGAVFTNTTVVRVTESPLTAHVDWTTINILQAKQVESTWARPLVMAEGGPLLLAGERDGYRAVVLTFRLQESDLPLQIAFPVLMANITSWLSLGEVLEAPPDLQVGDQVPISPRAGSTALSVAKPDGSVWSVPLAEETVIFNETDQPGIYRLELRDLNGDEPAGSFAVNVFAPDESAIGPAERLSFGETAAEPAGDERVGQRHLWPWLAGLAFTLLLVEWWIFHRGSHLPRGLLPRSWTRSWSKIKGGRAVRE